MPIRADKRNIPTVEKSVDHFLERQRAARKKDIRNLASVLKGAHERVQGKRAAGPALAMSELGKLPCHRVTAVDLVRWFQQRHPDHLAPATVKRGMSAMRGYLSYCVAQGWMDESVLEACVSVPDSNPRREWLHPEQLSSISELMRNPALFEPYECFVFELLRDAGLRTEEAVTLRRSDLDPRTKTLRVLGKGAGQGKERKVPVDDDFIRRWNAHADRFAIARDGYMLFHRRSRFVGGSNEQREWVVDKAKPTSNKALLRIMRKVSDAAERELPSELVPHFKLVPKVMRRTFACIQLILHALHLGGMNLDSLRAAMGHESLDTTRTYLADAAEYINAVERSVNTGLGSDLILEYKGKLAAD